MLVNIIKILKNVKENPFRDRLFKVFKTSDSMSFDDYLNMMSVMSESAPKSIKCRYAFRIYSKSSKKLVLYEKLSLFTLLCIFHIQFWISKSIIIMLGSELGYLICQKPFY